MQTGSGRDTILDKDRSIHRDRARTEIWIRIGVYIGIEICRNKARDSATGDCVRQWVIWRDGITGRA